MGFEERPVCVRKWLCWVSAADDVALGQQRALDGTTEDKRFDLVVEDAVSALLAARKPGRHLRKDHDDRIGPGSAENLVEQGVDGSQVAATLVVRGHVRGHVDHVTGCQVGRVARERQALAVAGD